MNTDPATRGTRWGLLLLALAACAQVGAGASVSRPPRPDLPYLKQVRARLDAAREQIPHSPAGALVAPRSAGPDTRLYSLTTGDGAIGDRFGSSIARQGDSLLVGAPFDVVVRAGVRGGVAGGTVRAFRRDGAAWVPEATLAPIDLDVDDQHGHALALSNDIAVVGAPAASRNGRLFAGLAFIYARSGTTWTEVARLEPPTPLAGDRFGIAVAIDGPRVLVGAPGRDPAGVQDAGEVHAYERVAGAWQAAQVLAMASLGPGARFGAAVALEGGLAAVGAPNVVAPGEFERGRVQVYGRTAGSWTAGPMLPAPSPVAIHFGATLLLDPVRLAVAAPDDSIVSAVVAPAGGVSRARVWVYPRSGDTLNAPDMLVAPDPPTVTAFGASLAAEGARLLVGAPLSSNGQGAAHVYDDTGAGPVLVASLALADGGNTETLGDAVALDGPRALLGAPLDDVAPNRAQGSVRSYDGAAAWAQQAPLQDGDGAQNEVFGFSLALDAARVAVGSYLDDPDINLDDAGTTSVFVRTPGGWQREARLVPAGAESEDRSGISVAMRDDVLAVGAYFDIVGINFNQGSVAIYARAGGAWSQTAQLIAPGGQRNDFLGFSLAYDGDTLLVGAPGDDSADLDAGAAYVFRRIGANWVLEAKLVDANAPAEAFAGIAVALSGELALVGAPDADVGTQILQGAVQVWRRGPSGWTQVQTLLAADGAAFDFLGGAIATDGQRILAGAPGVSTGDIEGHGAVYEFIRGDSGDFAAAGRLPGPSPEAGAGFGISVALAEERALVGASGASDGGYAQAGQAWLLRRAGANWSLAKPLLPADPSEFAFYGRSVAVDGARLAVGAPERAGANPLEGAVDLWDDDDRILADGFE